MKRTLYFLAYVQLVPVTESYQCFQTIRQNGAWIPRPHPYYGFAVKYRQDQPRMAFALPRFPSGDGDANTGPSEEVQGLYRMMGLAEDATYDEINAAYDSLSEKYAGETKRLIKLQVAKDKILEDRLRQRMSGSLKSAVAESPFERKEDPKPLITLPAFMQDYMELPTRAIFTKRTTLFGAFGLLPLISKTFASTSIMMGFACCVYMVYNRGVPDTGSEMSADARPPKAKPLILAVGLTLLAGAIGACFSQVLIAIVPFVAQELVISMSISLFLGFAACLFKVQEDYF